MNYYLGIPYLEEERLTHRKMYCYLDENGYQVPLSISFSKITMVDVMTGKYLLVREETKRNRSDKDSFKRARILAYQNPLRENLQFLLNENHEKNLSKAPTLVKSYPKMSTLYHD